MNKLTTLDALVEKAGGVASIAFGEGGIVRKPLAAAAALGLSALPPRKLFALLGGPEVDLLIGMGKAAELMFAYVGMDAIGLAPNFRRAREQGSLSVTETSEYLFLAGARGVGSRRAVPANPVWSRYGRADQA
jgi:glutaconate CoA-transferase, subunit A